MEVEDKIAVVRYFYEQLKIDMKTVFEVSKDISDDKLKFIVRLFLRDGTKKDLSFKSYESRELVFSLVEAELRIHSVRKGK